MKIRIADIADAADIARIHVDAWRSTYRGIVPEDYLASLSYEQRASRWMEYIQQTAEGRTAIYVAVDDSGQVAGFVSGGLNREDDPIYKSELYAIYILQAYQGQHIGRRLAMALVECLLAMGMDSMLLWVFAQNTNARRFYESLGGQVLRNHWYEVANVSIEEVAYGWLDIRSVLTRQR